MSARYKSKPGHGTTNTGTAAASKKMTRRTRSGPAAAHWMCKLAEEVGRACARWLIARGLYFDTFFGKNRKNVERGLDRMNSGSGAGTARDQV